MANNRRDKRRERYSRNTEGWNAQGFFGEAGSAYPADVTIAEFVYATDNAGEIGLYEDDGILKTTILLEGQKFTINQKNTDGNIKKSTQLAYGAFTVEKTLYDAPVIQVDNVSPLNIVIVGGLQEFVLSVRETTPANQPFPIQEGRAIVRSGTPTETDIALAIVADINNSGDFERNADNAFVKVNVTSDAAAAGGTNTGAMTLTDGSAQAFVAGVDDTLVFVAGFYLLLATGEVFKITGSSYDGANTTVFLDHAASIGSATNGVQVTAIGDASAELAATIDAALAGIRVEGVDELTHFDTSVSEDLGDAVIIHTTDWNFGSGAAWQVASIEDECTVFDGDTAINAQWHADYGRPDLWVDDSSDTQYQLYIFESLNRIIPSAGTPQNQTLMAANLIIAAPVGSTLESNLDTILDI